ncbi:MAG: membrane protein insertion efficiency factor YidD [Tunicatimonas sp.]|uniref:membrane protein insertion efficiency factor YidD n=1 Tax=Tunicatimonas sp. TaxID=1940096 RepID=UPI003C75C025
MSKIFLLVVCLLTISLAKGQVFTERVDGESISSGQSYFNDTLKKEATATKDYIGFYQKYISGIRGRSCPMYPSCSNYGLKTFTETNFASAFILTSDRLLRCGHDHDNYALTLRSNGFRFLDYPHYDPPPQALYYTRNTYSFAYSDTLKDNNDSITDFIKRLINTGYYREALLEIMRVEFQSSSFSIELFINKIICLKALEEYEKAIFDYETKCPPEHQRNAELLYQLSVIQYKLQNYQQSLYYDSLAITSCNDCFFKPKLISLQGLIHAREYEWQNSRNAFKSLQDYEGYEGLSRANIAILEKEKQFKVKNPTLAGVMSIIPGAGYAYAGHRQTAVTALLVNGLLAYATYTSVKNENYGIGILTGIFNLTFYIGNIQGAVKSAQRFNANQKQDIINKLEYNINL